MRNNLLAIARSMPAPRSREGMTEIGGHAGTAGNGSDSLKIIHQLFELSRQARVSLRDAIAVAERRHHGSRTVRIGFYRSTSTCYRVRTVKEAEIWDNGVDVKTGGITGIERVISFQKLGSEDRSNIKAFKHVTQGMSEAVQVAERVVPGMAVGGALINDSGTLHFVVLVDSGDRLKQVKLEVNRHSAASR